VCIYLKSIVSSTHLTISITVYDIARDTTDHDGSHRYRMRAERYPTRVPCEVTHGLFKRRDAIKNLRSISPCCADHARFADAAERWMVEATHQVSPCAAMRTTYLTDQKHPACRSVAQSGVNGCSREPSRARIYVSSRTSRTPDQGRL
jgi:hypothetical protein